jgi:penicillin-binding protein 2
VADSLNASIGQGYVLANPLQLAVMAARMATGG